MLKDLITIFNLQFSAIDSSFCRDLYLNTKLKELSAAGCYPKTGGFFIAKTYPMAEGKKSFILYADLIHTVRKMSKDEVADLFLTILSYVNDENPVVESRIVDLVFEPIKNQLKRDLRTWEQFREKQAINGAKGGRPKNPENPSLFPKTQKSLNVTVNDTVTVTANATENVTVKDGEAKTPPAPTPKAKKSIPILFRDSEYFEKEKLISSLDGTNYQQANVDYYHEIILNWSDGNDAKKINWLATVKNWIAKDVTNGKFIDKNFKPPTNGHYQNGKRPTGGEISDSELFNAAANYLAANGHFAE